MKKQTAVANYFKERKKLILVILLVVLLAVFVYIFFGSSSDDTATAQYSITYTETESKLAYVLSSMDGVGEVKVYVTESDGVISGVIVVCEGADSILVKNNVLNAVSTALNINKNIIAIYSM